LKLKEWVLVEDRWDHHEEDSSKHGDWHVVLGAWVSVHVNVKVHVVELVSAFLGLELVMIVMKDLGEENWYKDDNNSESEGPFLIIDVAIDRLRVPDRELSTASDDSLDVTDINCSNGQVPCPFLLEFIELASQEQLNGLRTNSMNSSKNGHGT
jgi:hypothetical protein